MKKLVSVLLSLFLVLPTITSYAGSPVREYYGDQDETADNYETVISDAFGLSAALPVDLTERLAVTPPNVGNQNFQDILTYFPELYCPITERTQASFSLAHPYLINEVVWVEVPIDSLSTGNNIQHYERGNRDLIAIRITRQRQADPHHPHIGNEANAESLVRLPVLMVSSPYRNNNIPGLEWLQNQVINVADDRFARGGGSRYGLAPYHPDAPFGAPNLRNNPDTSNLHYDNIRWRGLSLFDWPWSDDAHPDHFYNIPASRGARPLAMANHFGGAGLTVAGHAPGAAVPAAGFNNYMFTRGFAVITTGMSGHRWSNPVGDQVEGPFSTGMSTTGEVSRKLAAVAVTAWLNGEARAYTCPAANHEVVAYWANGDVIMTGTSYDGTTAYAAASSGFTRSTGDGYTLNGLPRDGRGGIRAIFPIAGIGAMYEYHRRHGAQYTPEAGLSDEAEQLGRSTQSLWFSPHFQPGQPDREAAEHVWVNIVRAENDQDSGNYNTWWDHNNFFRDLQPAVDAGIGILSQQGFDDLNVAITNNEPVHWAMHQLGGYHKQILHLHGHTNVWGWGTGRALEIAHAWVDYFVYGINGSFQQNFYANHAASGSARSLFDIEAVVACNVTGDAMFYSQWPPLPTDGHTYQGANPNGSRFDSMRRYYLGQNPTGTGGLLLENYNSGDTLNFVDCPRFREFFEPTGQRNPADPFFSASWGMRDAHTGGWSNTLMTWWEKEAWFTNAWESAMLFPTSTPYFRTGTAGNLRGFPAFQGVRLHVDLNETEILDHTDHRLSFVSAPIGPGGVTLAGVPRITLDIAADQHIGYISAMIVDIGPEPVSRAWVTSNQADYQIPSADNNNLFGAWARWRYNFNQAHTNQAHVVSRSSVNLENPNPPNRPIELPGSIPNPAPRVHGQPGVTYIDTDITINTGMYPPFTWQTTTITPGEFNSYTFTLEPIHFTFREGHRLAVVVYATDMKSLPRTDSATNFELQLGEGTFIYLPLLTELDTFSDDDVDNANLFLNDHSDALALTLANAGDTAVPYLTAVTYPIEDIDYENMDADEYDENGGMYEYTDDPDDFAGPAAADVDDENITDTALVNAARAALDSLSTNAQLLLFNEAALLDRLNALLAAEPSAIGAVQAFLDDHAEILSHDIVSVGWYDDWKIGWHDVGSNGDIIAHNNYIYRMVNNDAILDVVRPNIGLINDARNAITALDPDARALLNTESALLDSLLYHALAVEFRAEFHDVLWRNDLNGTADGGRGYQIRPHVDGSNYMLVRPRAQAAIAAWNDLPFPVRDLLGDVRNAAGVSQAHAQAGHQTNPIIRLNGILNRANRASAEIHSLVNIQGRPETFIAGYGQSVTAPNEVRIFGGAGNVPATGFLALTVAAAVPYAQTAITTDNINVESNATVRMFSDAAFTNVVNSINLTPGAATPVRVEVAGTHGTIRYTLNITRQNNNAELVTFAGQMVNATAEPNPGIYCPIRREYIETLYTASITVPTTMDAIRGEQAMAIAGVNVTSQTARTLSPGAVARIFAAPETRDEAPDILAFTSEIVGSRYIPLEPGVSTPVYVRVRSQAFSRTTGYLGVNYYRIMVTRERPTFELGGVQTTMVEVTPTITTDNFISNRETARNSRVWALTFNVNGLDANGNEVVYRHTIYLQGSNANMRGTYELEGIFIVNYDIRNNGATAARLQIIPK